MRPVDMTRLRNQLIYVLRLYYLWVLSLYFLPFRIDIAMMRKYLDK